MGQGRLEDVNSRTVKSLLVLQNFTTARKRVKISYILKAFFVQHSSEYETSDSDRKVIQNLYSQLRIRMARLDSPLTELFLNQSQCLKNCTLAS